MTNNELIVFADVARELANVRAAKDKYLQDSINDARKINNMERDLQSAKFVADEVKKERQKNLDRIRELEAERDDARRKLGALTLCVGFLKEYDTRHPTRSLETFKTSVAMCIENNHIVMTDGGMAK